jgi:ATP-binding cassette subfamily B protein
MDELERIQTTGHRKGALPNLIIASTVEIGLLVTLASGATLVASGHMELAVLAATFVILVRFAEPLSNLVLYASLLEMIEAALEQIQSMLAVAPLPQQQPQHTPEGTLIRFDDVSFCYEGKTEAALKSFSAVFPPRSMIALVGPSGSGKTTITRLLMRQADPQTGHIILGGVDLRGIPPDQLNAQIATVFQEVFLFDDTVMANLRMGCPDASDEAVRSAAQAAHCTEFIERLPQGWNTYLGEGGARLSGGERQRLSIARALLKNAPIIILDEPTASLDTESERLVQSAIDKLVRNKTVIVIAHRLSTIRAANLILVIEGGRCIQKGRHEDLLATPGRYRTMWETQLVSPPLPAT